MERSSLGIVINVDGNPAANVLCKEARYDIQRRSKSKRRLGSCRYHGNMKPLIGMIAHAKLKLRQLAYLVIC